VEESRLVDTARRRESGLRREDIRDSFDGRRQRSVLDFAGRSVSIGNRFLGPSRSGRSLLD